MADATAAIVLRSGVWGILVIDERGLRPNVGIILHNSQGQVLWARRAGMPDAWQFPQGGIKANEALEEAMYRELHEELGLKPEHVDVLAHTEKWLTYYLPKGLRRVDSQPLCVGQKQKWFLLQFIGQEPDIQLHHGDSPEFDRWQWVDWSLPVKEVVLFKREVYRQAMRELEGYRPCD